MRTRLKLFGVMMQEAEYNPDVSPLLPNVLSCSVWEGTGSNSQTGRHSRPLEANERSAIIKRLRNLQHVELDKHTRQDIIFTHVDCLPDA
jgi:hypothetical protein